MNKWIILQVYFLGFMMPITTYWVIHGVVILKINHAPVVPAMFF